MQKRTESKHLKYQFTDDELVEMSRSLARDNRELRGISEQKKEIMADFASQIKAKEGKIDRTSELIANGYEYRMVTCEVIPDEPVVGMKAFVRSDTGETWTEPMKPSEMQGALFEDVEAEVV